MTISIVMSTYNGTEFLVEMMDSIRLQTRKADEVLIFDDCSTDNTVDIISQYIKKYSLNSWRIKENSENKGWKKNFMNGLWMAKGDIILPCDQDDIWMNDKLEDIEKVFVSHPEIGLLTTNCLAFFDNGLETIKPEKENGKIQQQLPHMDFFEVKYPGCTYAVRKEIVKLSKKYWEEDFPHDAILWRIAVYLGRAYSYNKSLIRWRRHSTSTYTVESVKSKTFAAKRKWLDYADRALLSMLHFTEEQNVIDKKSKQRIIKANIEAVNARKAYYDKPTIINAVKLIKYFKQYPRKRQLLGDWYLVSIKKTN